MAEVSSTRGAKRKMADNSADHPSLLLLKIPADTDTSVPVWEALRSQQVDVTWTFKPYIISIHFTPATAKQGKCTTSWKSPADALSSTILQPQIVTQSVTQQCGSSQNTPCVLLTVTGSGTQIIQWSPVQPQAAAAKSVTPLIVSLPLICTQSQPAHLPSTPTKNAIQEWMLQALTQTPVPSSFHTKNSPDVKICDNFLLNMCYEGEKCQMHHTPYPFHWQLWSLTRHQWVSISPRSQVLLERMYCNINIEVVCIKDGNVRLSLNFDSMELDDLSTYEAVRRLTNSDSPVKNPHFPSVWKIYWWNNYSWEEYSKDVSTLLLKKMGDKEAECSFHIDAREYKLDFTRMTQINVTTCFERRVRCRPVYRSPVSMQPHLQIGVNSDSIKATCDPPGANFSVDPLEDFRSWYPPVWCLPSEADDHKLIDVPVGTQAYRRVQNLFNETIPETQVDIISIQQVQNLLHWDKYQRQKAYMQKQNSKCKKPLERHLFHGTTKAASEDISHNNFDPRVAGANGTSNGFGSYFSTTASYSHTYSTKVGPDEVRHMFLAKVLVGKVCVGKHNYRRPPPISSRKKHYCLYDTCVDNIQEPTMFVVFDSCRCYPYYLIKYKDLPREIDV